MQRKILPLLMLLILLSSLFSSSCAGMKSAEERQIEKSFTIAMNNYHKIWRTEDLKQAENLAHDVFSNKEIIEQVLYSHQESVKRDLGVSITEEKYNISVLNHDNNNATLKVKATLKGFPISISSGQKKIDKKQDFSFGPHNFEMIKEQGKWKISQF